jgi:hypothetical protein
MSRITTTKAVDLAAVRATLGVGVLASAGDDARATSIEVIAEVDEATLRAAVDGYVTPPDPAAQFGQAVAAIDTSKVTDPAAKAAFDEIKAVLTGGKGRGAEPRRAGG